MIRETGRALSVRASERCEVGDWSGGTPATTLLTIPTSLSCQSDGREGGAPLTAEVQWTLGPRPRVTAVRYLGAQTDTVLMVPLLAGVVVIDGRLTARAPRVRDRHDVAPSSCGGPRASLDRELRAEPFRGRFR